MRASIEDLLIRRSELLQAARVKVPGVQITANPLPGGNEADRKALIAEINELIEFVNRPTPGLHLDTVDTDNEDDETEAAEASEFNVS